MTDTRIAAVCESLTDGYLAGYFEVAFAVSLESVAARPVVRLCGPFCRTTCPRQRRSSGSTDPRRKLMTLARLEGQP